jgi:hypothetical protein
LARISNIKLRRSANAGAIPTTSNLDLGELALNTYDGKLYMKKSVSGTDSVVEIGAQGVVSQDIINEYRYVATNAQTSFSGNDSNSQSLSYIVGAIKVYLNGILLDPTQDFTASTGNTVVLVSGATVGDILQLVTWHKSVGTGSNTVQQFTGNGSATTFTLATNPINENQTNIYFNGVYKNKTSYSISGTTLDFGSGNAPANGVVIEVVTQTANLTATNIADLTITGNFTTNTISASGTITGNLTGNVTGNTSGSAGTVTSFSGRDSDDLTEGSSNLFFTTARFNSQLSSANTGSLAEGSNLYFTNARADARVGATLPNTGSLAEGSNLYFTNERVDDRVNALLVAGTNITTTYNDAAGTYTINSSGKTQEEIEDIVDGLLVAGTGITLTYNDAAGTLTVNGTGAFGNSDVESYLDANGTTFPDNIKAQFGAGNDLQIKHDGSNSFIQNGTGTLFVEGSIIKFMNAAGNETIASFVQDGSVELYHNNVKKFETASDGIDVTGHIDSTTLTTTGNVIVGGNLTISGTTTSVNSTTLEVADLNITVGKNATTSAATNGAGLTFGAWSSGTIPTFTWNHANQRFVANYAIAANLVGNVTGNVTGNVSGSSGTVTSIASHNTGDLSEGSNLYYTNARADARIAAADTGDLSEGSNLYYTNARADARIGAANIGDLNNVSSTGPSSGQVLKWSGSEWAPATDNAGGGSVNGFQTVAISGQSSVVADSTTDTLNLVAGTGITLTTVAGTDSVTITGTSAGANAFGNVAVNGQTTVAADSTNDTLNLVAGTGMVITTVAGTDTITIAGSASLNPFGTQLHTSTSGQTAFAIGQTPIDENALMVFVEGVYQNKNSYTISGSTLTFDSGLVTGDEVVIHCVTTAVNGTGHNTDIFTGNGSAHSFTLSVNPQTENNCFVFWDGVYQEKNQYTVSGTTIAFGGSNIPPTGTNIEVITPTITAVNVPTQASVVPNSMSTGGPSWDTAGAVTISESVQNTVTTSINSTSATNIISLPAATFRSAKVEISISDATSSDYEFIEVGMIHNGSTTFSTVYGQVFTGSAENGTITSSFSSGNMILQFTSANTNTLTIKAKYSALKV